MADKSGLERYQGAVVDWISSTVSTEHLKGLASHSDEEHELIDTVFRRFTELTDCVDRLDLCLSFIRAPMPRRSGVKADDYLMYHITFYLQEVFVLEERFRAYAKSVLRLRKRRVGLRQGESEAVDEMLALIREALSNVALARGGHVHARAFRDEEMRDLSMFSFLAMHNADNPEWQPIAKQLYRVAQSRWVEQITKSREAITMILNVYSDLMYQLVIDGSPGLLPNNSFKPKPLRGSA
jgi:hypothetical protein